MARNPELLRAIATNPQEDTVRLAYADWLQENGDEAHAELIRVQCELAQRGRVRKGKKWGIGQFVTGARRKELVAREVELLANPSFHLPGERPFTFFRGFVTDECSVTLTAEGVGLTVLEEDWGAVPDPIVVNLNTKHLPLLDRVLQLRLNLASIASHGPKWDAPLSAEALRRVAVLDCSHGSVEPGVFAQLEKCKHFDCATALEFTSAIEIPLDRIEKLILSAALPHLNHIHLDGEEWTTGHDNEVEDDELAAFVARLDAHEKAAQLRSFQLNWPIGPRTVEALLSATRLKPAEQLCLPINKGLKPTAKAALKKKFGKALVL
jgi:uncharacterized protein (TIGR02996 family)